MATLGDTYQRMLEARSLPEDQQRMILEYKSLFLALIGVGGLIGAAIQVWLVSVLLKCRRYFIDLRATNIHGIGTAMVTVSVGDV